MKKLRLISLVLVVAMLCSLTLPAVATAPPITENPLATRYLAWSYALPDEKEPLGRSSYNHVNGTNTYLGIDADDMPTWRISDPHLLDSITDYDDFMYVIVANNIVEEETCPFTHSFIPDIMQTGEYELYARCTVKSLKFEAYEDETCTVLMWSHFVASAPVGGSSSMVVELVS